MTGYADWLDLEFDRYAVAVHLQVKYALLDERDIGLVQEFAFEARVDVDRNGGSARIFAYAYDVSRGRRSGAYVHQLLW